MSYREQAEKIHRETRPDPRAVKMGFPTTPIQNATVDEIEEVKGVTKELAEKLQKALSQST